MAHRTRTAWLLWLALCGPLVACRDDVPPARDPAASAVPQRIVSLTPAVTEVLFALGVGPRVVGVTEFCDYPAAASRLPKVGGYANPSVEAVLSLRPDLVIVSPAVGNRDAALSIGRAGVKVAIFPMENLADAYLAIEGIAASCGVAAQGESLVRTLRERMSEASIRAAARKRVRALFCVQLDPIIAAGAGTFPAELLEIAGGENVIRAERYPQVGVESVLAEAPQVILHARMDKADPAAPEAVVMYWKRWPTIPAVRDGRVVVFDASAALRPGPRMAMAVEQLEAILAADAPGGAR